MTHPRRFFACLTLLALAGRAFCTPLPLQQPESAPALPLDQLKRGQVGVVWTVFQGTQPEPFQVTVSGVVRNALGPGKSLILCRMTDPRVQKMGAVAGMSGSPLYIDGKFAGALSYQITSFETEHFAGFTPAADMAEVGSRADMAPVNAGPDQMSASRGMAAMADSGFVPIRPSFTLSGLSPQVAALMEPSFRAAGLAAISLGGSSEGDTAGAATAPLPTDASSAHLEPGAAVSVALATGDITLAGTGTVSRVSGDRVVAFGHPMLSLGDVDLPMCQAEIVTIIPSALESIKIANTGRVIGTITQDRLSAVSGTIGRRPEMIDVTVHVATAKGRDLHFQVARQQQLTPMIMAAGLSQAIVGSNDAGLNNGFRISSDIVFSQDEALSTRALYAGPQAFQLGVGDFVKGLSQDLQNPYEKTFPQRVSFTVEPLGQNPAVTLDRFEVSPAHAQPGDTISAVVGWRDYQGQEQSETVQIPVPADWNGRSLEVVLAPGPVIDQMAGHPQQIAPAQLRSFGAYLDAVRQDRPSDGLYVAVMEQSAVFNDQTESTPQLPGSFARIAAAADEARFQQRPALLPLWEKHVLVGKLSDAVVRRPLKIAD